MYALGPAGQARCNGYVGLQLPDGPAGTNGGGDRLADRVADFEKNAISAALLAHGGSLKPVYEQLGISRKTLYEKMQRYGLDKNRLGASETADD